MTTKRIIAFNSAPKTGKDTVANVLSQLMYGDGHVSVKRIQLSLPMRLTIFAMLGLSYTEALYESIKDSPQDILGGKTVRQAMISLSEEHVKPLYGKTFWVESALQNFNPDWEIAIISDLGFPEELDYLYDVYERKQVLTVHMNRDDTTWEGDSRVDLKPMAFDGIILENDSTPLVAAKKILDRINSYC